MRLVAELGSNHNGSLERAVALLEAAASAGFSDVKTQAWRVRELFSSEALEARPDLLEREKLEVPLWWHRTLRDLAWARGMRYGVTVCCAHEVRGIIPWADWLKVGSYSLLDLPLLCELKTTGLPLVISTGMATYAEVWDAVAALGDIQDLTLLHCVSAYPAQPDQANLRSIPYLRASFHHPVGWSDHTLSVLTVSRALHTFGADMIELHFDLGDRKGVESRHSWTPTLVALLRGGSFDELGEDTGYFACDGKAGVKAPTVSETLECEWRADPSDGLRPLLELRAKLRVKEHSHAGTQQERPHLDISRRAAHAPQAPAGSSGHDAGGEERPGQDGPSAPH